MTAPIKAPFPWFGGKSRVAPIVWERFGDVPNYVEPFAGSLAVLLGRPTPPKIETVNDLDCYIANFWRAITAAPEAVAKWADWPVNEACLHARHRWLQDQTAFRERMHTDQDFYDAKIAGWWVWGICAWIGPGWCVNNHRGLPHLGGSGRGVHRTTVTIYDWFAELADRLRRVRVACGDWTRVTGPLVTFGSGLTGVFLDPPYDHAGRDKNIYAHEMECSASVREWAVANGDNPLMRIALCGYTGEHDMPADWDAVPWKASGGHGNQGSGRGRANASREVIWFSPHCLRPEDLFNQPTTNL